MELNLFWIHATTKSGVLLHTFLVESEDVELAIEQVEILAQKERGDGEPLFSVPYNLMGEPVEFDNHIILIS